MANGDKAQEYGMKKVLPSEQWYLGYDEFNRTRDYIVDFAARTGPLIDIHVSDDPPEPKIGRIWIGPEPEEEETPPAEEEETAPAPVVITVTEATKFVDFVGVFTDADGQYEFTFYGGANGPADMNLQLLNGATPDATKVYDSTRIAGWATNVLSDVHTSDATGFVGRFSYGGIGKLTIMAAASATIPTIWISETWDSDQYRTMSGGRYVTAKSFDGIRFTLGTNQTFRVGAKFTMRTIG